MTVQLRPFQSDLAVSISQAWQDGARDVLGVLACGGGKSVIAAHFLLHESSVSVFIAHRAELLSGESLALARNGVRHRVIGQPALRRECSRRHVAEGLYDHVDHRARVVIASVQTLVGLPDSDPLWAECRLLVLDEVHHQIKGGAHGKVREKMVNARAVGLSATPIRADGKGLGRHADGYMDVMIEGPIAREIELMGFLAPHVIYAPPSDIDLSQVPVAASGDYSPKPLAEATHKSHIVGDVVDHYRRLADGLLGMTFCVDVESATETAAAFRASGVPAEVVTGKTPPDVRNAIFRRFRQRQILQLVSCEIAGEGFDLPDVEVISLARASQSYALATQQIGRVKRALPGKDKGIVIDHVGNTTRHCQAKQCVRTGEWYIAVGEREWTLDRRERRTSSNRPTVAITTCPSCLRSYERVLGRKCPYCSHETQPAGRSAPEQVDGVLSELDPAALAAMQQAIAHVDGAPTIPWGATPAIQGAVVKRHRERQEAQVRLREAMAAWAGGRSQGQDAETVARLQREFYLQWGVDVATAQALGRAEAVELLGRITGAPGMTTCANCGNHFPTPKPSLLDGGKGNFCSKECAYSHRSKKERRVCEVCDAEFEVDGRAIRDGNGKFCSRKCAGAAASKKVERECACCGKRFSASASKIADGFGNYCSKQCQHQGRRAKSDSAAAWVRAESGRTGAEAARMFGVSQSSVSVAMRRIAVDTAVNLPHNAST